MAYNLQIYFTGMISIISKKMSIFLICFSLVFVLFLYPFVILLEDYISAAPMIGQDKEITLSEPTMMFLLGLGLIGVGIFARRTLRTKTEIL